MSRKPKSTPGINLNQLAELAKVNPKYSRLYLGLTQIDNYIKNFVKDIIESCTTDSSSYYIKTELMSQCYNLYLFHLDKQATIGVSWPLADFLEMCENKTIEMNFNIKIRQIIDKFNNGNLPNVDKIIWIH